MGIVRDKWTFDFYAPDYADAWTDLAKFADGQLPGGYDYDHAQEAIDLMTIYDLLYGRLKS